MPISPNQSCAESYLHHATSNFSLAASTVSKNFTIRSTCVICSVLSTIPSLDTILITPPAFCSFALHITRIPTPVLSIASNSRKSTTIFFAPSFISSAIDPSPWRLSFPINNRPCNSRTTISGVACFFCTSRIMDTPQLQARHRGFLQLRNLLLYCPFPPPGIAALSLPDTISALPRSQRLTPAKWPPPPSPSPTSIASSPAKSPPSPPPTADRSVNRSGRQVLLYLPLLPLAALASKSPPCNASNAISISVIKFVRYFPARWSMKMFTRSASAFLLLSIPAFAQTKPPSAPPAKTPPPASEPHSSALASPSKLPVRRVVLYKNGVGFFEHLGSVHGSQDVHIDFTSSQLNDVLNSLTVLDLSGGRITGVDYNSEAPLARRLATLRLALGEKPTQAEFLGALRGARIEVRSGTAPAITGKLLSIERKTRSSTTFTVETEEISLITDAGEVRRVDLTPATSIHSLVS